MTPAIEVENLHRHSAAAAAVPPARPSFIMPRDFPDRLSPILVKELRQGLRQPTFLIAFLCLQVLLCIVVLVAALSASAGSGDASEAGAAVSRFFFVLLGIALLVAQPLRGLNALASEIKTDTLDLLMLSRLSAWRITFGKWLALVSQSALLVVAVLPYLILRYYLGGMRLFPELFALGFMFVVSACLTAVTVGFSANASNLLRGLVGAGYVVLLLFVMQGGMFFMMRGRRGAGPSAPSSGAEWAVYSSIMLTLAYIGYYVLEMGATSIAPAAENRSTWKRLGGVAALALILFQAPVEDMLRAACWLTVATLLIIDAVSERPEFAPSVLKPFRRLGWCDRPARAMLLPGWPSGLLFAGALGAATVTLAAGGMLHEPFGVAVSSFTAFVCTWLACLMMPAAVRVWCLGRMASPFAAYVIALMGMLIIGLVLLIIGNATDMEDKLIGSMLICPFSGFVVLGQRRLSSEVELVTIWSGLLAAVYWVLAFLRALPHFHRVLVLDAEAAAAVAAGEEGPPSAG